MHNIKTNEAIIHSKQDILLCDAHRMVRKLMLVWRSFLIVRPVSNVDWPLLQRVGNVDLVSNIKQPVLVTNNTKCIASLILIYANLYQILCMHSFGKDIFSFAIMKWKQKYALE